MRFLLIILFSFACLNINAQHEERGRKHPRASKEKMEAHKIAFITKELDLTPEEAQVFWPVYNEYEKDKKAIKKERMPKPNLEELDDTQADKLIKAHLDNKSQGLALEKEYVEKFKQVLPTKKVLQLMIVERRFKEEVLKDLRKRLDRKQENRQ